MYRNRHKWTHPVGVRDRLTRVARIAPYLDYEECGLCVPPQHVSFTLTFVHKLPVRVVCGLQRLAGECLRRSLLLPLHTIHAAAPTRLVDAGARGDHGDVATLRLRKHGPATGGRTGRRRGACGTCVSGLRLCWCRCGSAVRRDRSAYCAYGRKLNTSKLQSHLVFWQSQMLSGAQKTSAVLLRPRAAPVGGTTCLAAHRAALYQ